MTQLILPGSPLIVCPELVTRLKDNGIKRYATDAAVFLQQLHFFLSLDDGGSIVDGVKWVYNSLASWQRRIKWLTDYSLRKIKGRLIELGIIQVQQNKTITVGDRTQTLFNRDTRDRSCWYTINYEHEIFAQVEAAPISTDANKKRVTSCKSDNKSDANSWQYTNDIDPIITPENTSKNTTTSDVVALSIESEYQEIVHSCPVCPEPPVKQVKVQPTVIDHSTKNSEERIKEVEALRVNLTPALRIAVVTAAIGVYEGAIALFKKEKARGVINKPTAFLLSALREGWRVPIEQTVKDKQARFIEWRKASKDNDVAAKYSVTRGDRIEISADNETWIEWEEK